MEYVLKITEDDGSYMLTCDDLPEFLSAGDTLNEALKHAHDALESAAMIYIADRRLIPTPRVAVAGETVVRLSAQAAEKVMLHNALLN